MIGRETQMMFEIKEREKMVERALLVGAYTEAPAKYEAASLLEELEDLVETLGIPVIDRMLVYHREQHPRHLIGSGKAEEIAARAKAAGIDVIIFDNELSPGQQRNWEELSGITVIDRTEVILDIFAKRAQSREARLQVELAQLEYSLPRLTRAWSHLVRQGGGIGARGEGETQLEQDKRRVRGSIDRCRRELEQVRASRATQRKDRKRAPVPNAAIVGYTNSGKSSLLRRLTGADVLIEDKLFATLDTTTRKVALPNKQPLLLTDTVGFVRRLPHGLVEAFRATLEEATLSDFLIHLLDASQPEVIDFYNTTMKVLAELGADDKRMLVAFNKIDLVEDSTVIAGLRRHFPAALFLSVRTGAGIEELLGQMADQVANGSVIRQLRLPQSQTELIARVHRQATVLESEYSGDEVRLVAVLPARLAAECAEWITEGLEEKPTRAVQSLETK
ncbi:MAG: GTPase [Chthoniobacter sp.]|jgi:GTP-binding protein HflX|nr:GTPase [Chthoniobacter sp.]